jgi:hypothetical protein
MQSSTIFETHKRPNINSSGPEILGGFKIDLSNIYIYIYIYIYITNIRTQYTLKISISNNK